MCPQPTPTFPAPAALHAMQAAQARPVHAIAPGSHTPLVIPAQPATDATMQQFTTAATDFWNANPNGEGPADAIAAMGILPCIFLLVILWKLISSGMSSVAHMIVNSERPAGKSKVPPSFTVSGSSISGGRYD